MADISQVKLPNGDTYNLVDETSGYLKSTDINLDNYVPIKKTIGDATYSYNIDYDKFSTLRQIRIEVSTESNNFANLMLSGGNGQVTLAGSNTTEIYNVVTPTSRDMAANKAYVDDNIPKVYSSTNTGGYLTMATLPIYDGTVE